MNLEFLTLVNEWALAPESKGKLIGFEFDDARFSLSDSSFLVLLNALPGKEAALRGKIDHFSRVHQRGVLHLVLLGDSGVWDEALTALEVQNTPKCRFYCYRLDSKGKIWTGPNSDSNTEIGKSLRGIRELTSSDLPEPAKLQYLIQAQLLESQKEAQELDDFQKRSQSATPLITYGVAIVLALVFLFEGYFGGTTEISVLSRMGANMPKLVEQGQWWRLLSAAFLHSGWLHAICNIYVLVALGKFVEQLIGGARLMSLLVLSALGGSVASVLWSPATSVGASGALWGLFGAAGALAFWPRGIIPSILVPRLKRSIMVNLGINLLISFAPQIDMAAHLGGGLTGALLAGSGFLFWGRGTSTEFGRLETPNTWRAFAIGLGLLSLGAFGLAQFHGQPWALKKPWHWTSVSVDEEGLNLEVPSHFSSSTNATKGEFREYSFGDFGLDGFVVLVAPVSREEGGMADEEIQEALKAKKSMTLPERARRVEGPRVIGANEVKNVKGIYEAYDVGQVVRVHSALLWFDTRLIRIDWVSPASDNNSQEILWRLVQSLRSSEKSFRISKE